MQNLNIISANVRGLGDSFKRQIFFTMMRQKADIIFVQETHSNKTKERFGEQNGVGKSYLIMIQVNLEGYVFFLHLHWMSRLLNLSVAKMEDF